MRQGLLALASFFLLLSILPRAGLFAQAESPSASADLLRLLKGRVALDAKQITAENLRGGDIMYVIALKRYGEGDAPSSQMYLRSDRAGNLKAAYFAPNDHIFLLKNKTWQASTDKKKDLQMYFPLNVRSEANNKINQVRVASLFLSEDFDSRLAEAAAGDYGSLLTFSARGFGGTTSLEQKRKERARDIDAQRVYAEKTRIGSLERLAEFRQQWEYSFNEHRREGMEIFASLFPEQTPGKIDAPDGEKSGSLASFANQDEGPSLDETFINQFGLK